MSFQRRVGRANRGALPYFRLGGSPDEVRVLVPLRETESLWVGVMRQADIAVSGQAGHDLLRIENISGKHGVLCILDGVIRSGESLPLAAATLEIVDDEARLNQDTMTILLAEAGNPLATHVGIIVAAPRIYAKLSGLPSPPPTSDADQYGGWRLP